jgi:multimeric flavodoxin WrbA
MDKVKIKLLGISCGHRKGRNTAWLTLFALKAAEKFGRRISEVADIETEFIDLWGKKIATKPNCELVDGNYVNFSEDNYITRELIPKIAEADGVIFGCPVFTGSYTSSFITLLEHLRAGIKDGAFTNKPAGTVTVATMMIAGQELCLGHMNMCIRSLGMIPVNWLNGACGVSGIPNGPLAGKDDGTVIALTKDRYAQWEAIFTGRRVAETAVIQKLAKRRLGNIYEEEFIKRMGLPRGKERSEWAHLDEAETKFMDGLGFEKLKAYDGTLVKPEGNKKVTCKVVGFSCDDQSSRDTSWLIANSLKAVEKFGKRIGPDFGFETEFMDLADKSIRPCLNCDERFEIPHGSEPWRGPVCPDDKYGCIIKNDFFAKEVMPRLYEGDGFVIGSSVCTLATSITFRIFHERVAGSIWHKGTSMKPISNIAVAYGDDSGQETCLDIMNTCNRWVEFIPVGWPHGTSAKGGLIVSKDGRPAKIEVKDDDRARSLSILNARRVAEFALMVKLGKQELGDIHKREFYQVIHPPHGEDVWEWSRLDKEDQDFMLSLTPDALAKLSQ